MAARTIKRRLSSVSGLFAYLLARGDTGVLANPVPRGWRPGEPTPARELGAFRWSVLPARCRASSLPSRSMRWSDLTHEDLDRSRTQLCAAGERLGKGSRRSLRTAMFGLEATLFHAGVTDELPCKRVMDKASERAAQWAEIRAVAPTLAETMTRYVEQVGLSLRPGTTRRHEAVTREFARFVLERDDSVVAAADVRRRRRLEPEGMRKRTDRARERWMGDLQRRPPVAPSPVSSRRRTLGLLVLSLVSPVLARSWSGPTPSTDRWWRRSGLSAPRCSR